MYLLRLLASVPLHLSHNLCWLISIFHHRCSTASPPLLPPPASQCLPVSQCCCFASLLSTVSAGVEASHEHQALAGWEL